jgi:predicted nucleotidyltransferase component of viral defense system
MEKNKFFPQVKLMLDCLPFIAKEKDFALKGGTAINFFIRDMPRLSVDVDLTYLPLTPRESALDIIAQALERIKKDILNYIPRSKVQDMQTDGKILKLTVFRGNLGVKIEPNLVLRGTVYPPIEKTLCPSAEAAFATTSRIKTVSFADLYAGKMCAALHRQHPRDLFDIKILFENEGISDALRKTFVVYLVSADSPIHELLDPHRKNIDTVFENQFMGMTLKSIQLVDLIAAREKLIEHINKNLTATERMFLISVKQGEPQWDLLGIDGLENFPALKWKLVNIKKMSKEKRGDQLKALKKVLGM